MAFVTAYCGHTTVRTDRLHFNLTFMTEHRPSPPQYNSVTGCGATGGVFLISQIQAY